MADVLVLAGLSLIVVGIGLFWLPLAIIVLGAVLVLLAFGMQRRTPPEAS